MADAETSPTQTSPDKPARRIRWRSLFRYRLRTLLVVTTLIAVWLGWWSHSARRQREVVEVFNRAGALVVYDFSSERLDGPPYWPEWVVRHIGVDYFASVTGAFVMTPHQGRASFSDSELKQIQGLTDFEALDLANTQISDDGLIYLQGLGNLETLDLSYTQITDDGLVELTGLTNLASLALNGTRITDSGLDQVNRLSSLRVLELQKSQVTNEGLEKLKGLKHLKWLDLSGTKVTDAGLEHLKSLTALTSLFLSATEVTDEGVARFQEALPDCEVYYLPPQPLRN